MASLLCGPGIGVRSIGALGSSGKNGVEPKSMMFEKPVAEVCAAAVAKGRFHDDAAALRIRGERCLAGQRVNIARARVVGRRVQEDI